MFKLDVETLEGLDRLGRKSAENLHAAIEAARRRPLSRILNWLGHPPRRLADRDRPGRLAGPRAAAAENETDAAWTRRAADQLRDASVEELTAVYGIGQRGGGGDRRFFADEHTRDTLHRLLDAGVSAEAPDAGCVRTRSRVR